MLLLLLHVALADAVNPFEEPDEAERFQLERQVVTVAARYAQTVEQAPSIVTVISSRELDELGIITLSEALRIIPGIYITTAHEYFELAWFRGTISPDNNKILLLVDGVPWYDGVYNHAWIDNYLTLDHIQQIEVIKGPGSAIYGSNAFSGVINLVTHLPHITQDNKQRPSEVSFQVGSYARKSISMRTGLMTKSGTTTAYARFSEEDGDGLTINPKGEENILGTSPSRSVNGGFRWISNRQGNLQSELRFDFVDYRHQYYTQSKNTLFSILTESSSNFNLSYRNYFAYAAQTLHLGTSKFVLSTFAQQYVNDSIYGWFGDSEIMIDNEFGSKLDEAQVITVAPNQTVVQAIKRSHRYGVSLDGSFPINYRNQSNFGVGTSISEIDQLEDRYFSGSFGIADPNSDFKVVEENQITDIYAYLQHTWSLSGFFETTAGIRYDDYSHSGEFVSPRLGVLIVPTNRSVLKMLYGRAFRAPNGREAFVQVEPDEDGYVPYTNGNPNLSPEIIDTIETELQVKPSANLLGRSSVFFSSVNDRIEKEAGVRDNEPELGSHYYYNTGSTTVYGGEILLRWKPNNLLLEGNYSYIKGTYSDLEDASETEERTQFGFPQHMGHAIVGYNRNDFSVRLRGDFYSQQPREEWSPDAGLKDGAPYYLAHLSFLHEGEGQQIKFSIQNLLDTQYSLLLYLDDANMLNNGQVAFPNDLQGKGRNFQVTYTRNY